MEAVNKSPGPVSVVLYTPRELVSPTERQRGRHSTLGRLPYSLRLQVTAAHSGQRTCGREGSKRMEAKCRQMGFARKTNLVSMDSFKESKSYCTETDPLAQLAHADQDAPSTVHPPVHVWPISLQTWAEAIVFMLCGSMAIIDWVKFPLVMVYSFTSQTHPLLPDS